MKLTQITHRDVEKAKKENKILYNVYFYIKTLGDDLKNIKSPSAEDSKERLQILNSSKILINELKKNQNSRKACMSMNYSNHLCRCMSMFHSYILDSTLYLNVYFRSMNYNKNMKFDTVTFYMLLEKMSKELNIKKGSVLFIVNNLHPKK